MINLHSTILDPSKDPTKGKKDIRKGISNMSNGHNACVFWQEKQCLEIQVLMSSYGNSCLGSFFFTLG